MKYVTTRKNLNGVRYYWQRPGYPLARLPTDEATRNAHVALLNKRADEGQALLAATPHMSPEAWKKFHKSYSMKAQRRGIGFELTWDEFVDIIRRSSGRCEVSGISFTPRDATKTRFGSPYQPSLDRIDSTGPYSAQNCRLVCLATNIALNEWGEDVLRAIAQGVLTEYIKRTKVA